MKILCISDAWLPQVNGVVRTYQNVGATLQNMGHSFRVIGPADFKFTLSAPTYPEIKLAVFARWTLPRMIREADPDTIHIATEGPLGQAARRFCLKNKIAFTTCYHSHFPDYLAARAEPAGVMIANWIRDKAIDSIRKFHAPATATMVATKSLETSLRAQGHVQKFHDFVRGIDTNIYKPGDATEFQDLKHPVALYVGRVAVEKNITAFLDADWEGSKVIVGDGPALAELKTNYPSAVFTGIKTGVELAAHYRSANVFAFPSKTDTFGIVLIEALASGLPVAAFPVTGPLDIITEPLLGALDDDFSSALTRAFNAPGNAEERAAFVADRYTWPHAARQFLSGLTPARK